MSRAAEFKEGRATALIVTAAAGLEREARGELRRILSDVVGRQLLLKGNLLVLTDLAEAEAVARIASAQTNCVARVVPVQSRVLVSRDATCFPDVAATAAEIGRLRAGDVFVVRCRRRGVHQWSSRDLERAVAARLEEITGAVGDYERAGDWHVTVQVYQQEAYVGVVSPSLLIEKELRKQRKYPPGERPLNRSQWKLREALSAFGIALPRGAQALDVGSAPGGWAAVLAETAERVVAVDPADLHPSVAARPNVEHLRCRAQELAGRGEWEGRFDLLTSDMNLDPAEAARIMCQLAPLLKPGAPAVMTVKYVTRQRRRHQRDARIILAERYEQIQIRRLPHNAKETTAAMRRKGAAESE